MGILSTQKRGGVSKALLILLFPLFITAILIYFLWGVILYLAIWITQRKPFVIFVYSDSPTWKEYMETEILPSIKHRAVVLNWSERRHWRNTLAVLAFRYFGGDRNFNPMAIVFQPLQCPKTYRFFEAFKEFKHGDVNRVESIKNQLFEALEIH